MAKANYGQSIIRALIGVGVIFMAAPVINWLIELITNGEYVWVVYGIDVSENGLLLFVIGVLLAGIPGVILLIASRNKNTQNKEPAPPVG